MPRRSKKKSPIVTMTFEDDEERDIIRITLYTVRIENEKIEQGIKELEELEKIIFENLPEWADNYFWYTIIPSKEGK